MKHTLILTDEQFETLRFLVDLGAKSLVRSFILRKRTAVSLNDIVAVQKLLKPGRGSTK